MVVILFLGKQCVYLIMDSVVVDTKKLWTISEYSKKMGVTRKTIYSWIDEKKLIRVNINGASLIYKP